MNQPQTPQVPQRRPPTMGGSIWRTFGIPLIFGLGYFLFSMITSEIKADAIDLSIPQNQLRTLSQLITANHSLNEAGYMTSALREFNEHDLTSWQKFRLKKWDYYDVITEDFVLTFALVDLFIVGEVRLNFFDYMTKEYKTFRKTVLPNQAPKLAPGTHNFASKNPEDNVFYEDDDFTFKITNVESSNPEYETKKVYVTCKPLNLKLEYNMNKHKNQEIMGAAIPLSSNLQTFFYTLKMPNIPADGTLDLNGRTYLINPNRASSFVDWVRAVFRYNTFWLFPRGQGFLEDGTRFALNFANGYGDVKTNKADEDSFFLNNTLHKLNTVETKYDDHNLMNPFNIRTIGTALKNSQCEIIFAPQYVENKNVNYVLIKSDMSVVYGKFSGWVTDENGNKYTFEDLHGYFEVFKTKW